MATGACRSCGRELPDAAGFCPRCGTAVDDVFVLPLVGEGPVAPMEPGEPTGRSPRTLIGIAVVVVLVLVALSTMAGDGGDEGAADATTSTTHRSSTTSNPRPSSTTAPGSPGRLLDPSSDLVLGIEMLAIVDARAGGMIVADLGTGRQIEIPEPPSAIDTAVWNGAVVLVQSGNGLHRLAGDLEAPWVPVVTEGRSIGWLDWTGLVSFQSGDGPWGGMGVVGADGTVATWTLPTRVSSHLMRYGGPRGAVGGSMILETSDGIYAIGRDGAVERISFGAVLGLGAERLLVHRCDGALRCELVLLDAAGAVVRHLPEVPVGIDIWMGGVAPDGHTVWISGGSTTGSEQGLWFAPGDEWRANGDEITGPIGGVPYGVVAWTRDSSHAAYWDQSRGSITVIDVRDLLAPAVAIATNRDVARDAGMGDVLVLVPRDAVPEVLRPPR